LVSIVLFSLLRRFGREHLGFAAAALYAFNPISVYEIRLAHWDGLTVLTVLLGLSALTAGGALKAGAAVGLGALLKQFPLALLPIAALKERNARKLVTTTLGAGAIVTLGFLPFLLGCPKTMLESLASHPLWNGEAPRGVGVGTVQQVFSELGVPHPKLVWFAGFFALLAPAVLRARRSSHFELTGLVLVVFAYFTYATHRQLVVWALPFLIVFSLERRTFWPLALVVLGYAIRVVKPPWYFGLVHLFAGAWYYAAMIDAGSRSFRRRPALPELGLARPAASERR